MTDRPLPFTAPMVRALLDGRKSQTRRVAKITAIMGNRVPVYPPEELIELEEGEFRRGIMHYASTGALSGPYDVGYAVGDRLYVREEYYQRGHWEPVTGELTKGGKQKWAFTPADDVIRFDAPPAFRLGRQRGDAATVAWHKRLGRFMPRKYSRMTLLVTDVRVERLNDCSETDAQAEGVEMVARRNYRDGYAVLWNSINGAGAWDANPWVVAVTFTVEHRNIDA